jgi:hypothetical protein
MLGTLQITTANRISHGPTGTIHEVAIAAEEAPYGGRSREPRVIEEPESSGTGPPKGWQRKSRFQVGGEERGSSIEYDSLAIADALLFRYPASIVVRFKVEYFLSSSSSS